MRVHALVEGLRVTACMRVCLRFRVRCVCGCAFAVCMCEFICMCTMIVSPSL